MVLGAAYCWLLHWHALAEDFRQPHGADWNLYGRPALRDRGPVRPRKYCRNSLSRDWPICLGDVAHSSVAGAELCLAVSRILRRYTQHRNYGWRGSATHYRPHRRSLRTARWIGISLLDLRMRSQRWILGSAHCPERNRHPQKNSSPSRRVHDPFGEKNKCLHIIASISLGFWKLQYC